MIRANVIVVGYILLTALCWQIELTNSRTSTLWKLNIESGKITTGKLAGSNADDPRDQSDDNHPIDDNDDEDNTLPFDATADVYAHDEVFYIIASTLNEGATTNWVRQSPDFDSLAKSKQNDTSSTGSNEKDRNGSGATVNVPVGGGSGANAKKDKRQESLAEETLDCGKPVNFTYYDYLIGVGQRFNHPLVPEPEVAYLFLKTKDETAYKNFDITALERRLKRAKREKPRSSVQLYNQIGNYWRIVGDARQAIECFRRALAMSPTNAEVLLNLARVLYNLQYLDDAIHLTRRSLEMKPPGRSAWQHYFTLGEIFKSYGHFQESILHLRHALELYPHHEPILKALRDVENSPSSSLHVYTLVIIIALVVGVFVVIITSSTSGADGSSERCNGSTLSACSGGGNGSGTCNGGGGVGGNPNGGSPGHQMQTDLESKTQRHFNRAMAMRSLKVSSSKNFRHRK